MTIIEFKAKKADLARIILNIESEDVLNEVSDILKKFIVKSPCQHSEEEMLDSGHNAIKAYETGELIWHEEIKRKSVE